MDSRLRSDLFIDTKDKLISKMRAENKSYLNNDNNKNIINNGMNSTKNNNMISNEPLFSLKETFICTFCG